MSARRTVLVVDFGAQYAQLIARRVREHNVYSEIVPHTISAAEVAQRQPAAIILSGGPKSVHVDGAPRLDPAVYDAGVPILGICYGAQLIAHQLGGEVGRGSRGEYGRTRLTIAGPTTLLSGLPPEQDVWMSHFDAISRVPAGFTGTAATPDAPVAVLENDARRIWGVQYHPEVVHSPFGADVLKRFLHELAGCEATWTMGSIIDEQVEAVRAQVGAKRVICGLSGGVDSSVAAALVHRAIGAQLTCVYVDTGLMRKGESDQVVETFRRNMGIELIHVDAGQQFFDRLAGVTEPETKRKIIGELFVRIFEQHTGGVTDAEYLVQGTLYPDVIESGGADGTAAVIKSHHNVGGLPEDMTLKLVEPLRSLFKDEVRRLGHELGLPDEAVPRPRFGCADHRRGHARQSGDSARSRRDRARRDSRRRTRARDLAGVRRVARHSIGGCDGRRAHVRAPDHHPRCHERRCHDGRLGALAVRPSRTYGESHHQRSRRCESRGLRHHVEAARHHRVGVVATHHPWSGD